MNVCDALLSETTARSFAESSLSPLFVREWPSLYEAFQDGRLDRSSLQTLLASSSPALSEGKRVSLGIDASGIARPSSPTLKDRSPQYVHNLPDCNTPVTAGWQFSALVVLPETPGSWTYLLVHQRISSEQTPVEVAAEQLRQIVPLLSASPLNLGDRGYGSAAFVKTTAGIACDLLLQFSSDRVFYRAAPAKMGKRGAPKKDGERFKCSAPSTHGPPDDNRGRDR
jgi:hypothetical protein